MEQYVGRKSERLKERRYTKFKFYKQLPHVYKFRMG
jgi:hypothetical protein